MSDRPGDEQMTAHASTPEPGDHDRLDLTDSDLDTHGDMGVSSEREGPTGSGQHGTTGVREVGPAHRDPDAPELPEQSAGGVEVQPDPVEPKAAPPSDNPRSD